MVTMLHLSKRESDFSQTCWYIPKLYFLYAHVFQDVEQLHSVVTDVHFPGSLVTFSSTHAAVLQCQVKPTKAEDIKTKTTVHQFLLVDGGFGFNVQDMT